ncbi:MAG: 16S rRNA (guanine(966)-N(2))-methyltransferase RsmD [Flavobacteriia bacterium]|nr:16S rRNA (guanine(966)-N(2))-methyltransferase RsmD [Flavobacteriia bacterium]
MRIISGSLKGRTFRVPPNFPSRPTTDYAKEGLFNILGNQRDFEGLSILDLCSGTGNLTFEFLSRGATTVTSVDHHHKVCRWIHKNATILGLDNRINVVQTDCLDFLRRCLQPFDIIVADPPYDLAIHQEIAHLVFLRSLLKEDGTMVIEHGKKTMLENETNFDKTRTFGNVNFSFFSWH